MPSEPHTPVMREVSLHKGGHHHVVRYQVGSEAAAVEAITAKVADPRLDFDWFDAAVMTKQVGQQTQG